MRDQISHLWFFDDAATPGGHRPRRLRRRRCRALLTTAPSGEDPSVVRGPSLAPARAPGRTGAAGASRCSRRLRPLDPKTRIPWYGPAMGARSFATARLMETWAHGQDVADALGVERRPTDRLRHVAHIGVLARPFSYANRGLDLPAAEVRVRSRARRRDVDVGT